MLFECCKFECSEEATILSDKGRWFCQLHYEEQMRIEGETEEARRQLHAEDSQFDC